MKEYTTARGVVIRFCGIAPLLDVLNGQFKEPDPPTYSRKNAGGVLQTFPHDETTLEDPDGDAAKTAANKAAWAEYQDRLRENRVKHEQALTRLCLLRGIEYEMPADETWVREQELIGFKVPEDSVERRLHYITTEVITTVEDAEAVIVGVLEASGVPEEVLASMADSFRRSLGKPYGDAISGLADRANGQDLVLQPKVRAGRRRDQKRNPAHERVRRAVSGG